MAKKRAARKRQNFIQRYIRETTAELRKVSWPTRPEALNLTKIVLVVLVVMGALFFVLDTLFREVIRMIVGL